MYSALKRTASRCTGWRARASRCERAPRAIEIFAADAAGARRTDALELEVLCSKGTYVRVLAEDIAARSAPAAT